VVRRSTLCIHVPLQMEAKELWIEFPSHVIQTPLESAKLGTNKLRSCSPNTYNINKDVRLKSQFRKKRARTCIYKYIYIDAVYIQCHVLAQVSNDRPTWHCPQVPIMKPSSWFDCLQQIQVTWSDGSLGHVQQRMFLCTAEFINKHTKWGPPVISWLTKAPVTIVISTLNHSYWSYKPT
jgi:hypothetical protein